MKLIDMTRNKIRCPVCGKFMDSSSTIWKHRCKPGDETNSLNNFLWCCKQCIYETTYWELYTRDYRVVAHACSGKVSPAITLRPYYDGFMRVGGTV